MFRSILSCRKLIIKLICNLFFIINVLCVIDSDIGAERRSNILKYVFSRRHTKNWGIGSAFRDLHVLLEVVRDWELKFPRTRNSHVFLWEILFTVRSRIQIFNLFLSISHTGCSRYFCSAFFLENDKQEGQVTENKVVPVYYAAVVNFLVLQYFSWN